MQMLPIKDLSVSTRTAIKEMKLIEEIALRISSLKAGRLLCTAYIGIFACHMFLKFY